MQAHYAFWPSRLPHAITTPATSLWFNLEVSARRYPHKAALVFMGREMSYRQLQHDAERLAAQLAAWGVGKGDRVLLYMQNCPQWVVAHFAILRANAVVVPVNPMNRAQELTHYIEDAGARVAITTGDLAGEMASASMKMPPKLSLAHLLVSQYTDAFDPQALVPDDLPEAWKDWLCTPKALPMLAHGQVHAWAEALACGGAAPEHVVGPDDLAVLPYTSGTTGLPKGCMHPHRTLMHNAVASSMWGGHGRKHRAVRGADVSHHGHGQRDARGALRWRHAGADAALESRARRAPHLALQGHGVDQHPHHDHRPDGQPPFRRLRSHEPEDHRRRWRGHAPGRGRASAAAVRPALRRRLWPDRNRGPFAQQSAGSPQTAVPGHPVRGDGCARRRSADPEGIATGEQGEIVVCGPEVFDGYWKHPDATAAAFMELDGKRFFRTGDLGRVDEEGYFFITDRLKRMINASGFKVWPAEVEMLMYRHPAIQRSA